MLIRNRNGGLLPTPVLSKDERRRQFEAQVLAEEQKKKEEAELLLANQRRAEFEMKLAKQKREELERQRRKAVLFQYGPTQKQQDGVVSNKDNQLIHRDTLQNDQNKLSSQPAQDSRITSALDSLQSKSTSAFTSECALLVSSSSLSILLYLLLNPSYCITIP